MYTEAKLCFATHDEDIDYFNMRIYIILIACVYILCIQLCSITSLWHSGQHLCRAIGRLQVRISLGFWLFYHKGAHYEVDYSGKNLLSWTAMHIDFVMCKKGDPSGFINIHSVAKYQKNSKGGPFGDIKENFEKVAQCRKKSKGGTLEARPVL